MSFLDKLKEKIPLGNSSDEEDDEYDEELDGEEFEEETQVGVLDGLVAKIKGAFNRGRDDDEDYEEDDDEDEEEEDGISDKTAPINVKQLTDSEEDEEYDEDDDEYEDEEEGLKGLLSKFKSKLSQGKSTGGKKKISPVAALVVLGIVYLGLDMISEEEKPVAPQVIKKKKSRLSGRKQKNSVKKSVKPVKMVKKEAKKVEPVVKSKPPVKMESTATKKVPAVPVADSKIVLDEVLEGLDEQQPDSIQSPKQVKPSKVVQRKKVIPYVEQPDYERLGRGLVYNCVKGYWACVDKTSYFQCNSNHKWAVGSSKDLECVPREVYGTIRDCRTVQIYNINTAVKTDFCR